MTPIIGAIFGLFGSVIPELLKIYKDRQDKKHELEMFKLQIEVMKLGHEQRMEEILTAADIRQSEMVYKYAPVAKPERTGSFWFDLLNMIVYIYNTTVRPTVTYLVIIGYLLVKYAIYKSLINSGLDMYSAIVMMWKDDDAGFVFMVISFWFGGRAILRSMGKIK